MPAEQLPVDVLIKYLATTNGRDKLYRVGQYYARFFVWYLQRNGATKDVVARWDALKSALGTSRRLLRVGKPVEHVQTLVKSRSIQDDVLRWLTMGKSVSYAAYLFYDMLTWFHSVKVFDFKNFKIYQERAARFWLVGICLSWLAGLYQLRSISQRFAIINRAVRASGPDPVSEEVKCEVVGLKRERSEVVRGLAQDSLDMFIPASTLKYVDVGDGFVGLAGVITGIMGVEAQWRKVNPASK